ncbi:cobalamin biosynthesis protein CbiG [Candidatus Endobugula sertula]|uniref:Cobalamin biosynthesis protein CbiG n=1 Tax=Candidatus Endobugula sertula TaxID=62101 RepID=A0A1D2QM31_9GAMM|nr:cobalamin biosynthesis protein CbiG [Candidatus Endobugula sertula]
MDKKRIRIISLTEYGQRLGQRLQQLLVNSEHWFKPKPFAEKLQHAFSAGDALVFIGATGIIIRTLAPVLDNKYNDPPVLVLDEAGHYVIPLLSGHQGGANHWASEIASFIRAQLIITTAQPYLSPVYTIGMGCARHCSANVLQELILVALQQAALSIEQIHSMNSIDIKADEKGLLNCANALHLPYQTYSKHQLMTVESLLSTKSEYVLNTVGVYGVAESAALFSAQQATQAEAELILCKIKNKQATCAIARSFTMIQK